MSKVIQFPEQPKADETKAKIIYLRYLMQGHIIDLLRLRNELKVELEKINVKRKLKLVHNASDKLPSTEGI